MRPAGLESLPVGYTRLEFLESTGTQYINTNVKPETATCVHCEFMTVPASSFCYVYGQQSENGLYDIVVKDQLMARCSWLVANTGLRSGWRTLFEDHKYSVKSTVDELFIDGVKVATRVPGEYYYATLPIFLFAANMAGKPGGHLASKIYSFSLQRENKLDIELIPVLDDTGTPCMFDTVTRKPFYNEVATGPDFIAGMTPKQALYLAYLPATGGNLTISLPVEAAFDTKVQNALNAATAKGWTFTFYWTDVIEYLTPRINATIGEGNYTISYDYTTQKLSLAFAASVTNTQIAEVQALLNSELTSNIVVEIDPFPIDFTSVEYLQSTKNSNQYGVGSQR